MNLKQKPDRSVGQVGDVVTVLGRKYLKSSNGVWGPVIDKKLLALIKRLYVNEGNTLRATALAVSDAAHTFSSSVIQNVINENKWMRSHYAEAEKKAAFLDGQSTVIFRLFDDEGFSVTDLARVIGVNRNMVAELFVRHGRPHTTGRRHSEARVNASRRMSPELAATWNRILTIDADECSYQEYRKHIRRLTDVVYRVHRRLDCSERSPDDHLDHILSLRDGYWETRSGKRVKRGTVVPFRLMAHPLNLRLVTRNVNLLKGSRSLHTAEELAKKVAACKVKLEPMNRNKELRMIARKYKLRSYEEI
jgi:hypothetical protein